MRVYSEVFTVKWLMLRKSNFFWGKPQCTPYPEGCNAQCSLFPPAAHPDYVWNEWAPYYI